MLMLVVVVVTVILEEVKPQVVVYRYHTVHIKCTCLIKGVLQWPKSLFVNQRKIG